MEPNKYTDARDEMLKNFDALFKTLAELITEVSATYEALEAEAREAAARGLTDPVRKRQVIVVFETVDVGGLARSLRERYPQMTQIVQGYHFKVVHRDSGKELGEE